MVEIVRACQNLTAKFWDGRDVKCINSGTMWNNLTNNYLVLLPMKHSI